MSGTVLLGLLGCGRLTERFHVPAIAHLPGTRLTAAWDPLPERRQLIARLAPGCRPFDSVEALLEARVVDAVLVVSSLESRASLAVTALGAGLPVLIEPPMAASLEEAEWIREAERLTRLPVMVGFHRRWWRPAERVRRALARGQEGELTVESLIVTAADDADPLEALAGHLDLVRHVVEREIAVVSGRREPPSGLEARVRFHGGGMALCRAARGDGADERVSVRTGVRSYEIRLGSERIRPAGGVGRLALDLLEAAPRRLLGSRDGLARSYEGQLEAFLPSVRSRAGVSPGTTDGMATLLASEALRRSLTEGGAETLVPATPST